MIYILTIVLALFLFWRFFFFFRNPKRKIHQNDRLVFSPADGFIVYVRRVEPGKPIFSIKKNTDIRLDDLMFIDDESLKNREGYLVGVFMSPFDVHYNRSPIKGEIRKIAHTFPTASEKNFSMFPVQSNLFFNLKPYWKDCDCIVANERASYIIKNDLTSVYVTQIADKWVKKIVTLKNNEKIDQGEIFGLIRMGSQVDLFIPSDTGAKPLVEARQRVKAGLTPLFEISG